jgi:hypothetical protein
MFDQFLYPTGIQSLSCRPFGKNYRHKLGLSLLQTPVLSENALAHHRTVA